MSDIIANSKNVDILMKYFDSVEPLNQWRTKVKKLEMEKKELLKVNFVSFPTVLLFNSVGLELRGNENESPALHIFRLQRIHESKQGNAPKLSEE